MEEHGALVITYCNMLLHITRENNSCYYIITCRVCGMWFHRQNFASRNGSQSQTLSFHDRLLIACAPNLQKTLGQNSKVVRSRIPSNLDCTCRLCWSLS